MRTFPSLASWCAVGVIALVAPAALAETATPPDDAGQPTARLSTRLSGDPAEPDGGPGRSESVARRAGTVAGTDGLPQTSDGVLGEIAPRVPISQRAQRRIGIRLRWQVAPGVDGVKWDERDARGPIRAQLLTIDYRSKRVGIDYADAGRVARTDTVQDMIGRDHAVAGVNGDFFDIGDTGAPLGNGRDRQRGLRHGRVSGWNATFSISKGGRPEIGPLATTTKIAERPGFTISSLNAPEVTPGGIGAYTRAWGTASGARFTGGQTRHVRAVEVRKGRVVSNRTRLPGSGQVSGWLLVGRGAGASDLAKLKLGTRLHITSRLENRPAMAISGNKVLVRRGVIDVVDDHEMHPRTAIGIDRDTHRILLLVVDGRQSFSRGYTMVELAEKMIELGADTALNLDGGGSSTMLARGAAGRMSVINSPSDGVQRHVANAVEVTYRK